MTAFLIVSGPHNRRVAQRGRRGFRGRGWCGVKRNGRKKARRKERDETPERGENQEWCLLNFTAT